MATATPEVIGRDLNETIACAIQARVEAAVAAELSSSDLFAQFVQAALLETITVKDGYKDRKTTYLRETISNAVKLAAKAAVQKHVIGEQELLEKLVATELRKQTKTTAEALVGKLVKTAESGYGITVNMNYPD